MHFDDMTAESVFVSICKTQFSGESVKTLRLLEDGCLRVFARLKPKAQSAR
jgi:hypothetical protein